MIKSYKSESEPPDGTSFRSTNPFISILSGGEVPEVAELSRTRIGIPQIALSCYKYRPNWHFWTVLPFLHVRREKAPRKVPWHPLRHTEE